MSNQRFIAVVGTIIVVLLSILLFQRYQECIQKGGDYCNVDFGSRWRARLHWDYEYPQK